MHAGTIVARNYLAQAQVLVDSFRRHHPDGTFDVLLIDDLGVDRPLVDGADVLLLDEIGIDPGVLDRMSVAYELIEIATAVKPWLLTSLLDRGYDHAIYFDPDISIDRPIVELPGMARDNSIVLTPHITEPMPRDGGLPTEQSLLLSGTYNLGFVAVGNTQQGRAMLDWWSERLRTDSFVDVANGFFTDQRFMDFVPGLFEHVLVKDPSWNVAYWNLATRRLSRAEDGGILVNGHPLTFTHLSGYSPRLPHLLSKHQGTKPRLKLSEDPLLAEICDDYGARLRAAGFESAQETFVSPFATFDGVTVDRIVRHVVRRELKAEITGRGTGLAWPDSEGQSLADWLADPEADETTYPNLGRYLSEVYRQRYDLQMAFPEVASGDTGGFLTWARTFGVDEMKIPKKLLRQTMRRWRALHPPEATRSDDDAQALIPGIEVVGYFTADVGLGETARLFVAGLERTDVSLSTTTYTRTLSRLGAPWTDRAHPEGARHDTALICINADMLPTFAHDVGPTFFRDRYCIGLWFWELPDYPAEVARAALEWVDEVWVCSEFNAKGLRRHTDKPIIVVPHPAHAPTRSTVTLPELADEDLFTFLFVFDHLSVLERKNPVGLIEAFVEAFPDPGEARLVIKSINGGKRPVDQERLRYAARNRPDVYLIERYLLREELDGLMWGADVYVSLHRSEGFGQTLAETMAIGKPVIATGYSGNLMFMTPENSLLVGHTKTFVGTGSEPYPPDGRWAAPKLGQAAQRMREVFEDPELRQRIGAEAAGTIARQHSIDALGLAAGERLHEIRLQRDPERSRPSLPSLPSVVERSRRLIRERRKR